MSWDKELSRASAQHLAVTAAKLKQLAGCSGKVIADCELRELIERLDPKWNPEDDPGGERATQQLSEAADIIRRLLVDCACSAINPPCAPCEDVGVLLACFEVEQCKVVRICNSVRQFVLAPSTLRYWGGHPNLDWCCSLQKEPPPKGPARAVEATASISSPPGRVEPPELRRLDALRRRAPLLERLDLPAMAGASTATLHDEILELRRRVDGQEKRLKERK
jgi:hypothetical protein